MNRRDAENAEGRIVRSPEGGCGLLIASQFALSVVYPCSSVFIGGLP